MNLAFFSRFSSGKKTNPVLRQIDRMKHHRVFRKARIDLYLPTMNPRKIIVLLGQSHTVWKGKIGNRERNKIVRCQARLCSYYAFFEQEYGVTSFGGEGIYDGLQTSFHDVISFQLYESLLNSEQLSSPVEFDGLVEIAQRVLLKLGKKWQMALRAPQDPQAVRRYASAVSGMTLFQFLSGSRVKVYPIEGEKAYQRVLQGITELGNQIERLEQTPEMKRVRQRHKIMSDKEASLVQQYHVAVAGFNQLIGSDIREQATFRLLLKKIEHSPLIVFTMGVGHRKNYLRMTNDVLKGSDIAFVFVTPPELLMNYWIVLGIPVLLLMIVFFLLFGMGGG